jgi:hypothetical protein
VSDGMVRRGQHAVLPGGLDGAAVAAGRSDGAEDDRQERGRPAGTPSDGAVLAACTDLPAPSAAAPRVTGLPVFDEAGTIRHALDAVAPRSSGGPH